MKTYVAVDSKKQGQALIRKLRNRSILASYSAVKMGREMLRGVDVFVPEGWPMDRAYNLAASLALQP